MGPNAFTSQLQRLVRQKRRATFESALTFTNEPCRKHGRKIAFFRVLHARDGRDHHLCGHGANRTATPYTKLGERLRRTQQNHFEALLVGVVVGTCPLLYVWMHLSVRSRSVRTYATVVLSTTMS